MPILDNWIDSPLNFITDSIGKYSKDKAVQLCKKVWALAGRGASEPGLWWAT